MAKKKRRIIGLVTVFALCLCGCSSDKKDSNDSVSTYSDASSDITEAVADTKDMFTDRDMENEYDENECIKINLEGDSASCADSKVGISDSNITIKAGGNYLLTGNLDNGMIIVEAEEADKVSLILNNVSINCDTSAAIYVRQADKVFITTTEGSLNTLSGGKTYEAIDENNIDATIFSKSDLTINGLGELGIISESGHGIVSKDDLKVTSGTIKVTSADHGLSGKDSVRIAGGNINIVCVEDGIHSENDEDAEKGFVYIQDGNINIDAGDDGIHAGAMLTVLFGKIDIKNSNEGLEGLCIEIHGGDINIVSSDDGLNAAVSSNTNQEAMIEGMTNEKPENFTPVDRPDKTQDEKPEDFVPGDRPEKMPGEKTEDFMPENMPEDFTPGGMQNGNHDGSIGGGKGGMDVQEDAYILIAGGNIYINAEGDGIDSNGSFTMTGGTVYVDGPQNGGNGALDYGLSASITGGTIIAVGASQMAENFTESENQASVLLLLNSNCSGGKISIYDETGEELASFEATKKFNSVVISCPKLKSGNRYTIKLNGQEENIDVDSPIAKIMNVF